MRRFLIWLVLATSVDSLIIVGGPGAVVLSRSECGVVGGWRAAVESVDRRVADVGLRDCDPGSLLGAGVAMYALPSLLRASPSSTVVHVLTNPFAFAPTRSESYLFKSANPLEVWCAANLKIERDARVAGARHVFSTPETQRRYGYVLSTRPHEDYVETPSAVVRLCLVRFGVTRPDGTRATST